MSNQSIDLALRNLTADFLTRSGWLDSIQKGESVDRNGPVPWFTYPAVRYLEKLVRPNFKVLEFGSGNSSRWWAERVEQVVSVEHDPEWAERLANRGIPNLTVLERTIDAPIDPGHRNTFYTEFFTLGQGPRLSPDPTRNYRAGLLDSSFLAYAAAALEYPRGHFDVIVVDGMARVLTSWIAVRQIKPGGIIVFDNSDRDEYAEGYSLIEAAGFSRIDFWGLGPINPYEWCTSVFVRDLQSLNPSSRSRSDS